MDFLNELLVLFGGLAGFAAMISLIVNVLKRFGVVTDGTADLWVKYLNLAGLVIVGVLWLVVPDTIPVIDQILSLLAQLGGVVLPLLALALGWPVANSVSAFTHKNVKGVKLFGYSNS